MVTVVRVPDRRHNGADVISAPSYELAAAPSRHAAARRVLVGLVATAGRLVAGVLAAEDAEDAGDALGDVQAAIPKTHIRPSALRHRFTRIR